MTQLEELKAWHFESLFSGKLCSLGYVAFHELCAVFLLAVYAITGIVSVNCI